LLSFSKRRVSKAPFSSIRIIEAAFHEANSITRAAKFSISL